jgi:hypothetical protein
MTSQQQSVGSIQIPISGRNCRTNSIINLPFFYKTVVLLSYSQAGGSHGIRKVIGDRWCTGTSRAAQYVRVSTDQQKYAIENQATAIAAYAARRNISIERTYSDYERSGDRIVGRDGLQQLIVAEMTEPHGPLVGVGLRC